MVQRSQNSQRHSLASLTRQLEKGIALHQRGRIEEAGGIYRAILKSRPKHADALHYLGIIQHQQGKSKAAIKLIRQAISANKKRADYHYNLAEVLRECELYQEAKLSYHRSLALDKSQGDAYFNLGNTLAALNQYEGASNAFQAALVLKPQDSEIHNNFANVLIDLSRSKQAIAHYRSAILIDPTYSEAHYNLGNSLRQEGQLEEAIKELRCSIELNEHFIDAKYALNSALFLAHKHEEALAGYQGILQSEPNNTNAQLRFAQCLVSLNRHDEAEQVYKDLLVEKPKLATAHYYLACCEESLGKFAQSIESHQRALHINPQYSEAYYRLSRIKSFNTDQNFIERLQGLLNKKDLAVDSKINLHFSLAESLSGDESFLHFQRANIFKSAKLGFDSQGHSHYIDSLINYFDKDFFNSHQTYGNDSELPVFVVGMPRSGSTLVEQILVSHSKLIGVGESWSIPSIIRQISDTASTTKSFPQCMRYFTSLMADVYSSQYLNSLPNIAISEVAKVCDKMLGNYVRLGLIALLFPNSRVIHCMRDPLDTCLSCYFQNFENGLAFSYDLKHLGQVYLSYKKIMSHWRKVLPLPIFDLEYEQLITSQEATSKQLIEFCGLEWESSCLNYYSRDNAVDTASAWQVRQPVYNSSVGRWREFETQLQPLIEVLENGGME